MKSPFYEVLSTAKSDSNDEARSKETPSKAVLPVHPATEVSCMDAPHYVSGFGGWKRV